MRVLQIPMILEGDSLKEPDEIVLAYIPYYRYKGDYSQLSDIITQVIDNLSAEHGYFLTLSAMEEAIEKARKYAGQVKVADAPLAELNKREVE